MNFESLHLIKNLFSGLYKKLKKQVYIKSIKYHKKKFKNRKK